MNNPADKFYAVQRFDKPRAPLHQKALYVVGLIGFFAAIVFNNWSPL